MSDIAAKRLSAAKLSGGTSSGEIYAMGIRAVRTYKPDARTILDFGTGGGQFLPHLRLCCPDADISAADIMERPPSLPDDVAWHRGDLNERLPIDDAAFDLICAIEVIEHLENPRHMLRELSRLLKPSGVAIVTTPNTGSYRSLITLAARGHHAQFDESNYPAHITPMSEVDFYRAGSEAGLDTLGYFYTGAGTIPKLLHTRWQALPLVGARLTGKRFSDNFGVAFRKP